MEKDKLDIAIGECLRDELKDIKMSSNLKDSITKETVRNKTLKRRLKDLMDMTIDIPIPSAVAACVILCFFTFSTFNVTENMKKDKSIHGYTSVRTIKVGNMNITVENENGGAVNEKKNKN